jgi:hypothetical protein
MLFSLAALQIVVDVGAMQRWFDRPVLDLYRDVFLYGGFIPVLWILWKGFSEMWLIWRQNLYAATIDYVLLSISVPRMNEQSPKAIEHMFSHIAGTYSSVTMKEKWLQGKFSPVVSFEYACIDGYTRFVVRCAVQYRDLIEASIFSQYPDAEISEIADYTKDVPHTYPDPEWDCWGTEFVLAKPSAYPLRTYFEFEHSLSQELKDPLATLLETLSRLKKGEQVWIQFLVFPGDQSWMEESAKVAAKLKGKEIKKPTPAWASAIHAATGLAEGVVKEVLSPSGEAPKKPEKKDDQMKMLMLSPGERKVLEGIEMKMAKIGFRCKIRFVYVGKRSVFRKGPMIAMIRGALGLFGSLDGNSFKFHGKASPKTDYFWQRWSTEEKKRLIIRRFSNRSSYGASRFVLNVEELASLWHFPQVLTKAPLIKKVESRKVEPPFALPQAPEPPEPPKGK